MFWDSFANLCREGGKTPNAVAKELNISSGSITAWKNGTDPRSGTVKKIADYFGVSVSDLLGEEKEKTANPVVDGLSDYDIKMLAWFHSLAPEQRKAILTLGGAPAELAEVLDRE